MYEHIIYFTISLVKLTSVFADIKANATLHVSVPVSTNAFCTERRRKPFITMKTQQR